MTSIALLELHEPLWVYITIPLMAGFIGYITKILLIEMMFRPLEFKGLARPWLGWQGQVPRNAARLAAATIDSLENDLLRPAELLELVDVDELLAELEGPLNESIMEITEDLAELYFPTVWAVMPDLARRAAIARVQQRTPEVTHRLLAEVRDDLDEFLDLRLTVVDTLVRDKEALISLFRGMGGDTFDFMKKAGLGFGLAIGVVQSFALMATGEELLLPLFGLITGGLTDWIALQMIFRPVRPGRFLGLVPWQGRFHKLRAQITRDYAAVMVQDILTLQSLVDALLTGPRSDRLFALIEREVRQAVDENYPALVRPFVVVAIGGREYAEMKKTAARHVIEHLPRNVPHAVRYAEHSLDLHAIIVERMERMTDEQYEGLLRPIFRDDEWLVVVLGAVLGFAFGEMQLHLLLS